MTGRIKRRSRAITFSAYKITNLANGRGYIGITTGTIRSRFRGHLRDAECCRRNMVLHCAIRKHGPDSFKIDLLAEAASLPELLVLERGLIAEHGTMAPSGYNTAAGGDGPFGYKHTEEWKRQNSERMRGRIRSPETRAKLSAALTGRKFTPEHCANLAAALKASPKTKGVWLGRKHSPEAIEKLRCVARARCTPEWRKAHSARLMGKPSPKRGTTLAPETKAKISASLRAYQESRRACA